MSWYYWKSNLSLSWVKHIHIFGVCTYLGSAVRTGGAQGMPPPPHFDRSVNPISIRRADYAHHITTCLPDFQTFLRHFLDMYILQICEYVSPKIRTDCFSNNINSLRSLLHIYSVKDVPSLKVCFYYHLST